MTSLLLIVVSTIVALLVGVPTGMLIFGSVWSAEPGVPGHFTLDNYLKALLDPQAVVLLRTTLLFSFGASALAVAIGTFVAWAIFRTDVPLRRLFAFLPIVPIIVPDMMTSISWIQLLNPRSGVINRYLMELLDLQIPPFNIHTLYGMIWVAGISHVPLAFLIISSAMQSMDPALEEAARMSGSNLRTVLARVTLPLVRPAILSAFILIFIIMIGSFETPILIGLPGKEFVYMSKIFVSLKGTFQPDYGLATAQAMLLLLLGLVSVYTYKQLTKRAERFAVIRGKGYRPLRYKLGLKRYLIFAAILLYLIIGVVVPITTLVLMSLVPSWAWKDPLGNLTTRYYEAVFKNTILPRGLFNSTLVSGSAAALALILATFITYLSVRSKQKGRSFFEVASMLPIAMPGMVLSIGLLWIAVYLPTPIYRSVAVITTAFIIKYMPHAVRFVSSGMFQVHAELEEAARLSGAGWLKSFRAIILPLLKPAFIAGWIYVFIQGFKELSAAVLLVSPGNEMFATILFDAWYISGKVGDVAAAGVLMILFISALVLVVKLTIGRTRLD